MNDRHDGYVNDLGRAKSLMATVTEPVHVAVGAIVNALDQALISKRHEDSHLGGYWEFPGGKVEAGETVKEALHRELQEELGITPKHLFPLIRIQHRYADKFVLLDVWEVHGFEGQPRGREGQDIRWQPVSQLDPASFPEANRAIIRCLQLPRQLGITPNLGSLEDLDEYLQHFSHLGVRGLQLRQHQLPVSDYRHWYVYAREFCRRAGILLIFDHRQGIGPDMEVDGLHLTSDQLFAIRELPRDRAGVFSAACHDLEQLRRAESLAVDLALLSPVAATSSVVEQDQLGWQKFESLAAEVSLPVYALGGMRRQDLPAARAAGAFGIAGIGDFLPVKS